MRDLHDPNERGAFVGAWRWLVEEDAVTAAAEVAVLFGVHAAAAGRGLSLDCFAQSIHPDDLGRFRSELTGAARSGSTIDFGYRVRHQDGTVRHVIAIGSCVRFHNNRPAEYLGAVHLAPLPPDPIELATDCLIRAAQAIRETDYALLKHLVDMAMLEAGHCLARNLNGVCVPLKRAVSL